ncbi:hypothetical protein SLEP1_g11777 [Rubroshorea leprosula]|nr:hypothetical protein SLEP1_g11777 [Rubroshorea leprosula]
MEVMESYLNENFGGVKAKHSSHEVLQKRREVCSVVKKPKRRFRFAANLSERYEADAIRKTNQVGSHHENPWVLQEGGREGRRGEERERRRKRKEEEGTQTWVLGELRSGSPREPRRKKKKKEEGGKLVR